MTSAPGKTEGTLRIGDDFEFEPRFRRLSRAGCVLKLQRVPLEALAVLIEQKGQIVEHVAIRFGEPDPCRTPMLTVATGVVLGALVAISSVSGLRSAPLHGAYGAAKAGLMSLVRTLSSLFFFQGKYLSGVRVLPSP